MHSGASGSKDQLLILWSATITEFYNSGGCLLIARVLFNKIVVKTNFIVSEAKSSFQWLSSQEMFEIEEYMLNIRDVSKLEAFVIVIRRELEVLIG